jgi:hypothetical protein
MLAWLLWPKRLAHLDRLRQVVIVLQCRRQSVCCRLQHLCRNCQSPPWPRGQLLTLAPKIFSRRADGALHVLRRAKDLRQWRPSMIGAGSREPTRHVRDRRPYDDRLRYRGRLQYRWAWHFQLCVDVVFGHYCLFLVAGVVAPG